MSLQHWSYVAMLVFCLVGTTYEAVRAGRRQHRARRPDQRTEVR